MPTEIDLLLQTAVAHHNAGRLAEAEQLYRRILARQPRHADALNLLGVIAGETGHADIAINLINQAIAVQPDTPLFLQNLAESLRRLGRFEEAAASMRRLVELSPDSPATLHQMADFLRNIERYDEARATYDRVLQLTPDSADAHNNRGGCLLKLYRYEEASQSIRRAIELNPRSAEAYNNLGGCLQKINMPADAIDACRKAISLKPDYADAFSNLGGALCATGDLPGAIAANQRSLELNPNSHQAHHNFASALLATNEVASAISGFRKALQIRPDDAETHFNLSLSLLLRGEYAEGWKEMEWRLKTADFLKSKINLHVPHWEGQDLHGRSIFVHGEQGFGDNIQFIRYSALLACRGANVFMLCPKELRRLFASIKQQRILIPGEPWPKLDFYCSLLSLPRLFSTEIDSIPSQTPYLWPEPELVDRWKAQVAPRQEGLRVGLFWQGRPIPRNRSIPLEMLEPLAAAQNVIFHSLQLRGENPPPLAPPPGMRLIDPTSQIKDFADTAALIANLDMVITIDSAVAHLSGALGITTWVFLPFAPDWRWFLDRNDSPWYPTMRLFRQKAPRDWSAPIAEAAAALAELANR